eukprot:CFRG0397T1
MSIISRKTIPSIAAGTAFLAGICYSAWPMDYLFAWHPFFMSFSFVVLMPLGISTLSTTSGLELERERKLQYHGYIQMVATSCAFLGAAIIFQNKENNEWPHFISWHGLIGGAVVGLCMLQVVGGYVIHFAVLRTTLRKLQTVQTLVHRISGVIFYTTGLFSVFLGLRSNWIQKQTVTVQAGLIAGLMIVGLLSLLPLLPKVPGWVQKASKQVRPK